MIICSCNILSDEDMRQGIAIVRAEFPHRVPTIGMVYRVLDKELNCKGCLPLAMAIVEELRGLEESDLMCSTA